MHRILAPFALLALVACSGGQEQGGQQSATSADTSTPAPPAADAILDGPADAEASPAPKSFPEYFRGLGTEPFWAVRVSESGLRYSTPEDQEGTLIDVTREPSGPADQVVLVGELDGKALRLEGRIEECSDGMSDRVYPFALTVTIGEDTQPGCARLLDP